MGSGWGGGAVLSSALVKFRMGLTSSRATSGLQEFRGGFPFSRSEEVTPLMETLQRGLDVMGEGLSGHRAGIHAGNA